MFFHPAIIPYNLALATSPRVFATLQHDV